MSLKVQWLPKNKKKQNLNGFIENKSLNVKIKNFDILEYFEKIKKIFILLESFENIKNEKLRY